MTIPTPIIGLIIALSTLVGVVVLLALSVAVPDALYFVLTGAVAAAIGGSVPSINVGGK